VLPLANFGFVLAQLPLFQRYYIVGKSEDGQQPAD
jgi:hypothetical protein